MANSAGVPPSPTSPVFPGTPKTPGYMPLTLELTPEVRRKALDEEVKMGFSPLPLLCGLGLLAGVAICFFPILFLIWNVVFAIVSGVKGAGLGQRLLQLITTPAFGVWTTYCTALGLGCALARRWSVVTGTYWRMTWEGKHMRFSLDDVLGTTVGTLFLAMALRVSGVGALFWVILSACLVPGFVLQSIWEFIYAPLIRRFGSANDIYRVAVVMANLKKDPVLQRYGQMIGYSYSEETGRLEITIQSADEKASNYALQVAGRHLHMACLNLKGVRVTRIAG